MKKALNLNHGNDEFYTPEYAIRPLLKYIPRDVKTIWCPCDQEKSKIVSVLRENGYKIVLSHIDDGQNFLTYEPDEPYDMIITNPPFSIKDRVIKRCYTLHKPFALLLPITALEGTKRSYMYCRWGVGLIVFDKRVEYMNGSCWFNTSWFIHTTETDGKLFFEKLERNEREPRLL